MSQTQPATVNEAVAAARTLPDLVTKLNAVDPALAQQIEGKALLASKTPWGTLAATAVAYLATKYSLHWDQGTCELVAGAALLIGAYIMRAISAGGPITSLFAKATTALHMRGAPPLAVLLALAVALSACAPDGTLTPGALQTVRVLCAGDAIAQPIAVTLAPTLLPQATPAAQLDQLLLHPVVVNACAAVGGKPATITTTSTVPIAPSPAPGPAPVSPRAAAVS